jgi:hypothetical protein
MKALLEEIQNFIHRKAWKKVNPKEILVQGRRPIKTKIVFKIKTEQDGSLRYKIRLVSKGYSMISGKDYTKSFSPVVSDTTNRLIIAISLYIMNHQYRWKKVTQKKLHSNFMKRIPNCDDWIMDVYDVVLHFSILNLEQSNILKYPLWL